MAVFFVIDEGILPSSRAGTMHPFKRSFNCNPYRVGDFNLILYGVVFVRVL